MFASVSSSSRAACPNTDRIGDGTVKSDRSVVVLHHFGLGCTIGLETAVSHFWWKTSGVLTLADSNVQLWHIVKQTKQVSGIYGAWYQVSGACRSISVLETDMTEQARQIRRVRSGRH